MFWYLFLTLPFRRVQRDDRGEMQNDYHEYKVRSAQFCLHFVPKNTTAFLKNETRNSRATLFDLERTSIDLQSISNTWSSELLTRDHKTT